MAKRTKPEPVITKLSLQLMLDEAAGTDRLQHIIGRALVGLYRRQTTAEQALNSTDDDNGIGFASCDARGGSLTAKSYERTGHLLQWQIENWTRRGNNGLSRLCKYHKQLNEIAETKRDSKAARLLHAQQSVIQGV